MAHNKPKKDKTMIIFWVVVGLIFVVFLSQFIFKGTSTKGMDSSPVDLRTVQLNPSLATTSNLDSFAQCITDKGATFYGTQWCSHCNTQKGLFGNSIKYVNFVDCDKNKEQCQSAGIKGYPTWVINGEQLVGTQQLSSLASATGCSLG